MVHLSVVSLEVLADFMLTETLSKTEINQWPPSTGKEAVLTLTLTLTLYVQKGL